MTSKKNKSLITLFLAFVMLFAIGFLVANNNKEFMTVAYVERDKGGAAVCLKKAEEKGINIKNIALEEEKPFFSRAKKETSISVIGG